MTQTTKNKTRPVGEDAVGEVYIVEGCARKTTLVPGGAASAGEGHGAVAIRTG